MSPAGPPRHPDETQLVRAARALADGTALSDPDYAVLRRYLVRLAVRRSTPDPVEAQDVTDEALTRFLAAARQGQVDSARALPYLITIVQNEIIDRHRKRRITVSDNFEDQPMNDDAIARLLDADATASILEAALRTAAHRRDLTCTLVVNEWLRQAEQEKAAPSGREVARRANVSHVTVQKALQRLRGYVQEVSAPP